MFIIKSAKVQTRAFDQEPGGLAGIQGAASAEPDYPVASVLEEGGSGFAHILFNRVRVHRGIHEPFFPLVRLAECLCKALEGLGLDQAGVGCHQRTAEPDSLEPLRQLR